MFYIAVHNYFFTYFKVSTFTSLLKSVPWFYVPGFLPHHIGGNQYISRVEEHEQISPNSISNGDQNERKSKISQILNLRNLNIKTYSIATKFNNFFIK